MGISKPEALLITVIDFLVRFNQKIYGDGAFQVPVFY